MQINKLQTAIFGTFWVSSALLISLNAFGADIQEIDQNIQLQNEDIEAIKK